MSLGVVDRDSERRPRREIVGCRACGYAVTEDEQPANHRCPDCGGHLVVRIPVGQGDHR